MLLSLVLFVVGCCCIRSVRVYCTLLLLLVVWCCCCRCCQLLFAIIFVAVVLDDVVVVVSSPCSITIVTETVAAVACCRADVQLRINLPRKQTNTKTSNDSAYILNPKAWILSHFSLRYTLLDDSGLLPRLASALFDP